MINKHSIVVVFLVHSTKHSVLFKVQQISEDPPCRCEVRFCIEKQPKGRYRMGDKVLYVRVSVSQSFPSLCISIYISNVLNIFFKYSL